MVAAIVIPATSSSAAGKSVKAHHPPKSRGNRRRVDTEYQAAVKRNDAVTMSRLLADDFVLVVARE